MVQREKGSDEKKSLLVPSCFALCQEAAHVAVYAEQLARFT
jgi:hypothetical protein